MVKVYDYVLVTRNARDKVQVAKFVLEQEGNVYTIKRYTGQFGGKMTEQPKKEITAGKVKRTVFQQAELEFNSLVKKSLDKGYKRLSDLTKTKYEVITAEELNRIVPSIKTDANGNIKPQLAKSSEDCSLSVLEKKFFASRKIDGVRCMLTYDQETDTLHTVSRGGGDYDDSTVHIRTDGRLLEIFRDDPSLILDGELYVHGWSLQKISGTCRLKKWEERCSKLQYWIFDYVDNQESFNNRLDFLTDLSITLKDHPLIKVIEHEYIEGWVKIKKLHDKYVQEGYEGLVLRKVESVYEPGKRSSSWIKVKDHLTEEFEIIGASEGLRPEDMVFTLVTKEGRVFEAKPVGSREVREEYLENIDEYIGKMATVHFFNWTDDRKPLQPRLKCIREEGV